MTDLNLGTSMVLPDLSRLLVNDTAGDLLDWGSGVICAQVKVQNFGL